VVRGCPADPASLPGAVRGRPNTSINRPTPSVAPIHTPCLIYEQRALRPSRVRVTVMGYGFSPLTTLPRSFANLPLPSGPRRCGGVSREEGARLLATTATLRERALLMTTYGGGLRVGRWGGCGSRISTRSGTCCDRARQGRQSRYTLLGPRLLATLRQYGRVHQIRPWLFPQRRSSCREIPRQSLLLAGTTRGGFGCYPCSTGVRSPAGRGPKSV